MDLSKRRKEYAARALDESDLSDDPIAEFSRWFAEASSSEMLEPQAAALATVDDAGRPSLRFVLMKEFDARGFTFATNYESRKGRELETNPEAALTFYWDRLERQVRIEGTVERCSAEESDRYFAARPRGSQLAAWTSEQSAVVTGREALEARYLEMEERFADEAAIPRPEWWGGYRLVPRSIEFWQGRVNRLHDRVRYVRRQTAWQRKRVAP